MKKEAANDNALNEVDKALFRGFCEKFIGQPVLKKMRQFFFLVTKNFQNCAYIYEGNVLIMNEPYILCCAQHSLYDL